MQTLPIRSSGRERDEELANQSGSLLIVRGDEVSSVLEDRDAEVIHLIREAYKTHTRGDSSLPHSSFVTLPGRGNRIIALPGFLGGSTRSAGMKWIASVPANVERGMDRASALIVLNDVDTGFPSTVIEGSLISARRTAASAVLLAGLLSPAPSKMALIGCGAINFEIARMMCVSCISLEEVVLFDLQRQRAESIARRLASTKGMPRTLIANSMEEACRSCHLISMATIASQPHVHDKTVFQPGALILHISLRDLAPELILQFDNIVDDRDHVCRAETSIHLAEKSVGNREFIRCTVGDILLERAPARMDGETPIVFSPFGLGVLDLALSKFVTIQATKRSLGTSIPAFYNPSWKR